MRAGILVIGLLIAGFGIVAPALGIPLNTLSTGGPITNPTISCVGNPAICTVTVTVENPGNWGGTQSLDYWLCIPGLGSNPSAQCGTPGSYLILLNQKYNVNVPVGSPETFTETLACQSDSVQCDNAALPPTSGIVYSVLVQVYSGPPYSLETTSNEVEFTTTGGVTTTTFTTPTSGAFSVYYLPYITLNSVSPQGSGVSTCTSKCLTGLDSYTATWSIGTQLSVTATFNSVQYNVCWEYSSGGTCTPIESGTPFAVTTQGPGNYVILQATTSTTQPVTILACVSATNPCNASDLPGSWSPAAATLSSTGTSQVTFKFTASAGYACPTGWYLYAPQSNQNVAQGANPCQGVTLTWTQMQALEASSGTQYQLVSTGSVTQTSTLSVLFGGAVTSVTCGGQACPTQITGPTTIGFLAFCGQFVICQSVSWTVNGNSVPGDQNGMTYSFTTSQNYVVLANGVAPTGCFQSTSGTTTTTTCNSSTSSTSTSTTSVCLGSTCVSGINGQSVIVGFGGLIALVGLVLPKPGVKKVARSG